MRLGGLAGWATPRPGAPQSARSLPHVLPPLPLPTASSHVAGRPAVPRPAPPLAAPSYLAPLLNPPLPSPCRSFKWMGVMILAVTATLVLMHFPMW